MGYQGESRDPGFGAAIFGFDIKRPCGATAMQFDESFIQFL